MNVNVMMQALSGDIAKLGQAVAPSEAQDGAEFEDMLLQQSKASQAQRREEKPKDNAAEKSQKKDVKKPQEKSAKEQEKTEDGYQVAAGLVTSQPLVPIEVVNVPEAQYAEGGAVVVVSEVVEVAPQVQQVEDFAAADEYLDAMPEQMSQPDQVVVEQQAVQVEAEVKPEAFEAQAQPKVQVDEAQPQIQEVEVKDSTVTEVPVEKAEAGSETEDEDSDLVDVSVDARPVFRRDTTPVKVAENYETLAPEAEDAPQQLAGVIDQALTTGANTVLMELNPANLGQLSIQISRNAAGELAIVMIPQTVKAADILTQHSANLAQALADRGEQVASVQVRMPEQAENANMFLNPDGHNQRQPEDDERKRRGDRRRTEGVNATDFLQQLRLGLVGLEQAE